MSQAGGPSQRVGGVHFDVSVRGAQQATTELNATATATQNLGNKAQEAGRKAQGATVGGIAGMTRAVKDKTKVFRDAVSAITGFIGRISAMIGVFALGAAAAYGLARGIGAVLESLVKQGRGLKDFTADVKQLLAAHEEVNTLLEKLKKAQGTDHPLVANIDEAAVEAAQLAVKNLRDEIKQLQATIKAFSEGGASFANVPGEVRLRVIESARTTLPGLQQRLRDREQFLESVAGRSDRVIVSPQEEFRRKVRDEARGSPDFWPDRLSSGMEAILLELQRQNARGGGRDQ